MIVPTVFLACGLASMASASLYVTAPVGSTTCTGDAKCTVSWQNNDQHDDITLSQYGQCTVSLYTGSTTSQIQLFQFGTLDPSDYNTMDVTIPSNIGPDGEFYFIRFQQVDPDDGTDPLEAFSARFTLTGMSGSLSPAASQALAGQAVLTSVAPVNAATSSAGSSPTSSATSASGSASMTSASSAASASASHSNAGPAHVLSQGLGLFAGFVAALTAL